MKLSPTSRVKAKSASQPELSAIAAAVQIVVEDAADAARLVAMFQEEIFVAPRLQLAHSRRPRRGARRRPSSPHGRRAYPHPPACAGAPAPASDRRRRRTTPSTSRRSACSCGRSGRSGSRDGRSPTGPRPRSADLHRRRESAWRIRARTNRTRSRRARPSFRTRAPATSPSGRRRRARRCDRSAPRVSARTARARAPRRRTGPRIRCSSASMAATSRACSDWNQRLAASLRVSRSVGEDMRIRSAKRKRRPHSNRRRR